MAKLKVLIHRNAVLDFLKCTTILGLPCARTTCAITKDELSSCGGTEEQYVFSGGHIRNSKGECVKEVKRLNGNFTFKDANDWQKGYYTKENDVEKEADTNSPWGDNLRASFVENCQDFCTIRLRRGRNI